MAGLLVNSPIANDSERNLFEFVRRSGFVEIHSELHIDMLAFILNSWEVFLSRRLTTPLGPTPQQRS